MSKAAGCRKDGAPSRMLLSSSDDQVNLHSCALCTWFRLRHVKLFNELSLHRVNAILIQLIYVSEPFFPFPGNSLLSELSSVVWVECLAPCLAHSSYESSWSSHPVQTPLQISRTTPNVRLNTNMSALLPPEASRQYWQREVLKGMKAEDAGSSREGGTSIFDGGSRPKWN